MNLNKVSVFFAGAYNSIVDSIWTPKVVLEEEVVELENNQALEELDINPMDLMVGLAIVSLKELREQLNMKNPKIKIKISAFAITSATKDIWQSVDRTRGGASRDDLSILRKHIIKALKWFPPYEDEDVKTICKFASAGLGTLYNTYKPEGKKVHEDALCSRLKSDAELIDRSVTANDKNELALILESEESKAFPLRDELISPEVTRDMMVAKMTREVWMKGDLSIIAKQLTSMHEIITSDNLKNMKVMHFDTHMKSLEILIQNNPGFFADKKKEIHIINKAKIKELGDKVKIKELSDRGAIVIEVVEK